MDDCELLRRYSIAGDESAFATIVERHLGIVFGVAIRSTGDRTLAEEVTQDVFGALARKSPKLSQPAALSCWLHRAAALQSALALRTKLRREQKMKSFSKEHRPDSIISDAGKAELLKIVDLAINELKPEHRSVVLLRFFDGLTFREIGDRIGKSTSSAERMVDSAVERLSRILKRKDVVVPATTIAAVLGSELSHAAPISLSSSTIVQGALNSTLSAASSGTLATSIALMTKPPIALTLAGLLIAFSAVGGVQLGRSHAKTGTAVETEDLASISSGPVADGGKIVAARETDLMRRPPQEDKIGKLIAQVLALTKNGRSDPATNVEVKALLAQVGEEEIDEAMSYLDPLDDVEQRMHLGKGLFARWAELDGVGAARGVFDRSRGRERDIFARAVASSWPSADHRGAFAWYQQEGGEPEFPLDRMASRLLLAHVFVNWLEYDRDGAISAFATLQYDDQKAAMLGFSWRGENGEQILRELAGE